MANPLYSAMNTPQIPSNILEVIRSGGNPMNLLMQFPQGREFAQMIRNGVDPQRLFFQECQRRGINPNDILRQLK